jgi:hypothetical protein
VDYGSDRREQQSSFIGKCKTQPVIKGSSSEGGQYSVYGLLRCNALEFGTQSIRCQEPISDNIEMDEVKKLWKFIFAYAEVVLCE